MKYQDEMILREFKDYGQIASYHFADDTGREWSHAHSLKNRALELYKENPNLQDAMREISKNFLWGID